MNLTLRDPSIPDSPLARWDARWKLAALTLAVIAAVAVRHVLPAAAAFLASLTLTAVGRVPLRVLLGRLGVLVLAVLPFLIVLPLTAADGTTAAALVALRVLAVGTLALVLVRTAPLPHTLAAAHALGVPGVLVQVAQLAHRYTFLLGAEALRTRVALRVRGFRAGTNVRTYRTVGHALGGLLARGGDRADRVSEAMRCRGFDGTVRTLTRFETSASDVVLFLLAAGGSMAVVLADRLLD